jgi:HTH-type transcriptional regulator/antitoxin HipB
MQLRAPIDIGAAIRDRRRRLFLGQDELAARVGVSRKWIIDIEKGKPRAAMGLVLRTLAALGLRLSITEEGAPVRRKRPKPISAFDIDRVLEKPQVKRRG